MEEIRSLKVINELGMHARAAGQIVELAGKYKAKLFLMKDSREVDGLSILSILSLACPKGGEVEARIIGVDAKEFIDELERLFKSKFGETGMGQYRPKKKTMKGFPVSPGITIGKAHHLDRSKTMVFYRKLINKKEVDREIDRFRQAVDMAKEQIQKFKSSIPEQVKGYAFVLDTHSMILDDSLLFDSTLQRIQKEKVNAGWALKKSVDNIHQLFKKVEDEYIGRGMDDVDSVSERVLQNLTGVEPDSLVGIKEKVIVVAHSLSPCDIVELNVSYVMGILTDVGSRTSHMAIMSEALEIPVVVGLESATDMIVDGDLLIVDGNTGDIIINPEPDTIISYEDKKKRYNSYKSAIDRVRHLPAETSDGYKITIKANIEFLGEAKTAIENGAEGIGLYRTEYLYMIKKDFPDEQTLFDDYSQIAKMVAPNPVTIRTLDIASDKMMASDSDMVTSREDNPALGLLSIRFCLSERNVFKTQLRAILRASVFCNFRLMFPVILGLGQFLGAKRVLKSVMRSLDRDGIEYNREIPIGILIEIPSATSIADILAKHADFFSIGTNDLIQYALAIDRDNEHVAHLYEPFHPAVLRMIHQVVKAGNKEGIDVSLCGEIAGDPLAVLILLSLGLEEFSMNIGSIPLIKKMIRMLPLGEVRDHFKGILQVSTSKKVESFVLKRAQSLLPNIFEEDVFRYRATGTS
ncbi:MAG: phosphoenolpyruvate--protein phosphotransferase [Deltaproteobacteria bacterium]|nr:MAG: phosphoenolpyruvate--protein phosphotransferase [Deltaproteobacteria bacterium]